LSGELKNGGLVSSKYNPKKKNEPAAFLACSRSGGWGAVFDGLETTAAAMKALGAT
jgi:hypothetical protein